MHDHETVLVCLLQCVLIYSWLFDVTVPAGEVEGECSGGSNQHVTFPSLHYKLYEKDYTKDNKV